MLYKIFYGLMTIVYAILVVLVGCFTMYKLGVEEGSPLYAIPLLIFWQFSKKAALAKIGLKPPVYRNVLGEIITAYKAAKEKRVADGE